MTEPDSSQLGPVIDQRQWVQTGTEEVPPVHQKIIFY